MANQVAVPRPTVQFNAQPVRVFEFNMPDAVAALGAGETCTCTLPANQPREMLPVAANAFSLATPALPVAVVITSHNRTTGVTVLTFAAGAPLNTRIILTYADVAAPV